jgi:two-component system response regulator NreC
MTPVKKLGFEALTKRELQSFHMFKFGASNQQVADALGVSIKTVETYASRINLRLGIHSRVELILYAVKEGHLTQEMLLGTDEQLARLRAAS